MNNEWKRIADMLPGFEETTKGRIVREELDEGGFSIKYQRLSQIMVAKFCLEPGDMMGLPYCDEESSFVYPGNVALPTNLLSGAPYVPAAETDVRKTMDRERARLGLPIPKGRRT